LILSLSGVVTASTIKAVKDQSSATGEAATPTDYINAIQEMAEREIALTLSVVYDMFEAGNVIAFSSNPEEKEKALSKIEASNEKLDQLATGYQKNLETLQEKMEKQMDSLTPAFDVPLGVDESLALGSFKITVKEVRLEQLPGGEMNNEVVLEVTGGEEKKLIYLKGGQEFSLGGYTIKYVSLIYDQESKRMEAQLRVAEIS